MNSYFRLDIRKEGVFLRIYPPTENGTALIGNEVIEYLNNRGYNAYDLAELNRAMLLMREAEIRVGDNGGHEINEKMDVQVSLDYMEAVCRFYPPSKKGGMMSKEEIIRDLQFKGVCAGIKQEEVQNFLTKRTYCTDYVLAAGKPPIQGKDAEITYYFNTDVDLRPKRNEDGTVDYHELGIISHVSEGGLLAKLQREDPGKPGQDVLGHEVKPKAVKTMRLSFANNIELSEDETELHSKVTGHASLVDGKVFVSNVYEVPADVDHSIGNIDYQGNVHVRGNVKGGFQICAKGDIIVEGVVEDADLQAGGQIIVKRGIHGKNKGILRADGNVICTFIENATVISGGYVESEAILHSQVSAKSAIYVNGKKGFITGGLIRAGNLIQALTIGSEMGAATRLEVGADPEKKKRCGQLLQDQQNVEKEIKQIQTILTTYSQKISKGEAIKKELLVYLQQLAQALKTKQQELDGIQEEYTQLQREIINSSDARVKVQRSIYPGVSVSISDVSLSIKSTRSFCQMVKKQGDISIETL